MSASLSGTTPFSKPMAAYQRWARIYDAERNPMLALEQRYLVGLLPNLKNLDIVDLGCGTGRWLDRMAEQKPRSLFGADVSSEMLNVAHAKLADRATLVLSDCESLSLPTESVDVILCSFLLSYVDNIDALAQRIRTALRSRGSVFLSDVHPTTLAALGWRRGFHEGSSFREVTTRNRPLKEVISAFSRTGLDLVAVVEAPFGEPERPIFDLAGKLDAFNASLSHPAIYLSQFSLANQEEKESSDGVPENCLSRITNARITLGPNESTVGELCISNSQIRFLGNSEANESAAQTNEASDIDLSGFLILPGLINAHDHLEFALFPRLGKGNYRNFLEWASDIHVSQSSVIETHRAVPKNVRLWWGGIRNVLSGVTTVCHHNPYSARVFENDFIVRVARNIGWAHSLGLDPDAAAKARSTPVDWPFILHLGEGIDEQSSAEIRKLSESGALREQTVIVHGLAFDDRGLSLLRDSGAGLVWCPTSNDFLFGRTLTRDTLQSLPKVALGSDSPLTANGDLLDEIHYAREVHHTPANVLYEMTTSSAARMLCLCEGEGHLRVGARADFIAVRDSHREPAESLATLSWRDIELVVIGGRIQLASHDLIETLPRSLTRGLQALAIENEVRWLRAPLPWLFAETRKYSSGEIRMSGRKLSHEFSS